MVPALAESNSRSEDARRIDEVLGAQLPTFEDVPRLTYTERVFTEAMRLYPPVWVMGRRAVSACKIGATTFPPNR